MAAAWPAGAPDPVDHPARGAACADQTTVSGRRIAAWLARQRIAAIIIGFAGPVLNPQTQQATGNGPLLIIADGTCTFQAADIVAQTLSNLRPAAWEPDSDALTAFAQSFGDAFDTYWLSDGLARDSRDGLLAALEQRGTVTVFQSPRQIYGLRPARFDDGEILLSATRTPTGQAATPEVTAIGLDPAGVERPLATVTLTFNAGDAVAETALVLPPELRNRITRFEITGARSAAAVSLTDDSLKRREVAMIAGRDDREGLELLSPLFYLREALEPTADLIDGTLDDILLANPDVLILADVATLAGTEAEDVLTWVENGGLLLRFAGPRLAASDTGRIDQDPLLPVRLRSGGRSVGGAMSWGEPKALAPFDEDSPFFGLDVPDDVTVTAQVMAQPDPTLADRVIAQLADGTPLVTRTTAGEGQIVLVHVTANAEWSTLPLSGLFVQMLERLAISTSTQAPSAEDLVGTTWLPNKVLDATGRLNDGSTLPGVPGEDIAAAKPGPDMQPGLYTGDARQIAVNVMQTESTLGPAIWPAPAC